MRILAEAAGAPSDTPKRSTTTGHCSVGPKALFGNSSLTPRNEIRDQADGVERRTGVSGGSADFVNSSARVTI
jgi:hypothetical protein